MVESNKCHVQQENFEHLLCEVDGEELEHRDIYAQFPLEWRKVAHRGMCTRNLKRQDLVLKMTRYDIYCSNEVVASLEGHESEGSDMSQD
ncbi:hypothetical protein BdWA1_001653 [Babesia duncani]|uniref:Uncharacterized protein n=1 Tax=Babesia duncani TaxID=323732 RepID=A0AAD9UP14_9APIC|nr:hypothetical protein BdWA1_001653 [Babesia duncani]